MEDVVVWSKRPTVSNAAGHWNQRRGISAATLEPLIAVPDTPDHRPASCGSAPRCTWLNRKGRVSDGAAGSHACVRRPVVPGSVSVCLRPGGGSRIRFALRQTYFPNRVPPSNYNVLAVGARFLRRRRGLMPTKGKLCAFHALVAFEPANPLPIMRPRQCAAAQRERFTASLIHHT